MLCVGMDGMGWVVIICHRSSKSTFSANEIEKKIGASKTDEFSERIQKRGGRGWVVFNPRIKILDRAL